MKLGFYPKLAWEGIRKNKRLYLPYILTCIGMVMMCYIVFFLTDASAIQLLPGGYSICAMLDFGGTVLSFFAVLFLFYTNSFLIRRRKREFGLYNILGMGKGSIGWILFWETVIIAAISLLLGIFVGVLLSKLFELGLVNMMGGVVEYAFRVSANGVGREVLIFGMIFTLLFFNGLRQVSLSNPVALLRSESAGEKPPKANWALGAAGVMLLAAAYYMAVTIEDPITAIMLFFVAVAMVIGATYLLFITGSVALCRLLQKNKGYYYTANHFVSVSSMAYRMKRNGAGLASICILLTMVLVSLSSTAALFIGTEESLSSRYPREITMQFILRDAESADEETIEKFRAKTGEILNEHGAVAANIYDYRAANTYGFFADNTFVTDEEVMHQLGLNSFSEATLLYFVPISDYNRVMGENETLEGDEVIIFPFRTTYPAQTFQMAGGQAYRVKKLADKWIEDGDSAMSIIPTLVVFVPDLEAIAAPLPTDSTTYRWRYGFDLGLPDEEQIQIFQQLQKTDWSLGLSSPDTVSQSRIESRAYNRDDFYGTYGGLFYLGIILSIVFLAAAVLIIYYKQISEGYEDQNRFEIMQKVGMTGRDIRRSINSQMLTVFFLPLITAGCHLCFAFPLVRKLLLLFNLTNTGILIATTALCFVIFGVFYAVVYKITSNAYFSIVSGGREKHL